LRSFQERLGEFEKRGVRLAAISVDPPEVTRAHVRKQGYTFPFLSDTRGEALRLYDLVHAGAGPGGGDLSRPAEFLIDATGTVRWVNLTGSYAVRARPEQVLEVVDALGLAAPRPDPGAATGTGPAS
jgi:peroxiredoxin